jgi:magnesium transporter
MSIASAASPGVDPGLTIRAVFRSGSGAIDLDWPAGRIAEAVADGGGTLWVDILSPTNQLQGVESLFRDTFGFHPLAIDDALCESHSPKVDDWSQYLYLVFHSIDFAPETDDLRLHELDMFLGSNYLVTYHTEPISVLEAVRKNLSREGGAERLLKQGADHLLYQILDLGSDDFLTAIEHLDEAIDEAQDEVFHAPTTETLHKIFRVKRAALRIHRIIAPQREVLNRLARDQYAQIDAHDRVYFRDVYDHLVRLHDITETLRDLISGALDTYLSAISNRTNEIMKALTLVTVMFLPMSFLAGFFGMNFFGETLSFRSPPLPRALLFWTTCLVMLSTPLMMWLWARRRGWF